MFFLITYTFKRGGIYRKFQAVLVHHKPFIYFLNAYSGKGNNHYLVRLIVVTHCLAKGGDGVVRPRREHKIIF